MIVHYVDAIVKHSNASIEESTDDEGVITILSPVPDSIALLFRFCPDRFSAFPITDSTHNYFEFGFEPWIAEVLFKKFQPEGGE